MTKQEVMKQLRKLIYSGDHNLITETFKEFWDLHPSEKEFSETVAGLPMTSGSLYYMVTHPFNNGE